jgi:DNA-binding NtrC family response regulator
MGELSLMTVSPAGEQAALAKGKNRSTTYEVKPLEEPRWKTLVESHSRTSVFHTVEWPDALRRTDGRESIAFTTCPPGSDLKNAVETEAITAALNATLWNRKEAAVALRINYKSLLYKTKKLGTGKNCTPGQESRRTLKVSRTAITKQSLLQLVGQV